VLCRHRRERGRHVRGPLNSSAWMTTICAGNTGNAGGPYVSERAWGTVREDYSPYGTAWESVPHDHARSKAYRWNEDGLAGICDRHQFVCLALALWNGRDPILKERMFGLTGNEGNHGRIPRNIISTLIPRPRIPT
jgi:hypothetical protein